MLRWALERDQLVGLLQKRYGKVQADIEREVNEFEGRLV